MQKADSSELKKKCLDLQNKLTFEGYSDISEKELFDELQMYFNQT